MVNNGHGATNGHSANSKHSADTSVVPVTFDRPSEHVGDVEVTSLDRMRRRAGPDGFSTVQRLDFDLVMRIDHGTAIHTVDFLEHRLREGDILWIRAGQIHRWGRIADIDGPVVLFTPLAIDDRTRQLLRATGGPAQNHWPATSLRATGSDQTWDLLHAVGAGTGIPSLEHNVRAHVVTALVTQLALAQDAGAAPGPSSTRDAFIALREAIESHFATDRNVRDYAARLGYSTRTITRLAHAHTGLTAKQLIDERITLEAKRLLSHSDDPVARIATTLGFDDASNFSAFFTIRTGSSPGAFRRTTRQELV